MTGTVCKQGWLQVQRGNGRMEASGGLLSKQKVILTNGTTIKHQPKILMLVGLLLSISDLVSTFVPCCIRSFCKWGYTAVLLGVGKCTAAISLAWNHFQSKKNAWHFCLVFGLFFWPETRNAQTIKVWQLPPNGSSYLLYKPRSGIKIYQGTAWLWDFFDVVPLLKHSCSGINNFNVGLLEVISKLNQ